MTRDQKGAREIFEFHKEIAKGLDDIQRGKTRPIDEVREYFSRDYDQRKKDNEISV